MKTPKCYLSKRENGAYSIIYAGMPVNDYTIKERCLDIAKSKNLELSVFIWSAEKGEFITE